MNWMMAVAKVCKAKLTESLPEFFVSPVLFGAGTHTHTGRNSDSQHAYLLLKVVSFHHSQSAKLAHCQIVIKSLTIRFCACVFSAKTAETVSILKTRRAKMRAGNETERRLKAAAVVKQQKRLCRRLLFFTDWSLRENVSLLKPTADGQTLQTKGLGRFKHFRRERERERDWQAGR